MSNNIDQYAKVKLGGGNEFMAKLACVRWRLRFQSAIRNET